MQATGNRVHGGVVSRTDATGVRAGFTLIELALVLSVIGILVAVAIPGMDRVREWQAGRSAARSIADAFTIARGQAIRSGHNHIVFFSSGAGVDPAPLGRDAGNGPLLDANGEPAAILVLDDGAPGSPGQDCRIGAGESTTPFAGEDGVDWGVSRASSTDVAPEDRPNDASPTIPANGITFETSTGAATTWVLFRPDGLPVAFDAACNADRIGSGGGTVYLTTGSRDYAVTLSPLGGVRVHAFLDTGVWTR